jgi:aminoglycoside 6-adenylyltransferase
VAARLSSGNLDDRDPFLKNIVAWASDQEPIRALLLVGSRALPEPADALADYDVQLYTVDYRQYTRDEVWLSAIGRLWMVIPESYEDRGHHIPTRLANYEGGIRVDFAFYPLALLRTMVRGEALDMGYRVLLDKDGATSNRRRPTYQNYRQAPPSEAEFIALVEEFWFEAYHVAKYLWRRELWLAKFRDWNCKTLLLRMIEWRAQARANWDLNTWFLGKNLREWAGDDVWPALDGVFGRFHQAAGWEALLATLALFRRLGQEAADLMGYGYPQQMDDHIAGLIIQLKQTGQASGRRHGA